MYKDFYQLQADPFRLSPDHRFCFTHSSYEKAKAYMKYALHRAEGFVMITGKPGTGKTTLVNDLLDDLSLAKVTVAVLVSTQLEADDLLRVVAFSFGLNGDLSHKATILQKLREFLTRSYQEGRRALLIVDEAQDLSISAMEELRLLTNLQINNQPLLQIFLLGQEELRDLMQGPKMEQGHQRIVAACQLEPLKEEETAAYIRHRLRKVGWKGNPQISTTIFPIIHKFSLGIPRKINLICSRLFLHAFVEKLQKIGVNDIRIVLAELQQEQLITSNQPIYSKLEADDLFDLEDDYTSEAEQSPEPGPPAKEIRSPAAPVSDLEYPRAVENPVNELPVSPKHIEPVTKTTAPTQPPTPENVTPAGLTVVPGAFARPTPNEPGQPSRSEFEEKLQSARAQIEKRDAQRAESRARLDELKSRLESLQARLDGANKAIETAETNARVLSDKYAEARRKRDEVEEQLKLLHEKEERGKEDIERLEGERRARFDDRANLLATDTRLKAQFEILEQAEQSLAGYSEGARFLLDAERQSRIKGARGALSAALDVPAELEVAIAAALGDTLDAVMVDASEIEDALQLLEADEVGRAVLLPLEENNRQSLVQPNDDDCLGIASELVNVTDDMRTAVQLMLGQTLVVRTRATARRLIKDLPTHARVVTLLGEVFRGDGLIIAGKSASSSALSRPRQKRELTESLTALSAQIESLNNEVDSLSAQIADVQRELTGAESAVRETRIRLDEAKGYEKQAGLETESTLRELEWQKSQHVTLKADADEVASIRMNLIEIQTQVETESAKV